MKIKCKFFWMECCHIHIHCVASIGKTTERKVVLKLVLYFMQTAKENGTLNKFLDPIEKGVYITESLMYTHRKENYNVILPFLICDCDEQFKQFLKIFSSVYSNYEQKLCGLLEDLFNERCTHLFNGKTQKALNILRELGWSKVLSKISHVVLKRDPQLFREFYQPHKVINTANFQKKWNRW